MRAGGKPWWMIGWALFSLLATAACGVSYEERWTAVNAYATALLLTTGVGLGVTAHRWLDLD